MWSSTLFFIILFIVALIVAAWLIVEYGQKQARLAEEYEKKYERISKVIDTFEVCELNYDWIMLLLQHLGNCKYKNREKTSVLTTRFFFKYQDIAKKRVSQND